MSKELAAEFRRIRREADWAIEVGDAEALREAWDALLNWQRKMRKANP